MSNHRRGSRGHSSRKLSVECHAIARPEEAFWLRGPDVQSLVEAGCAEWTCCAEGCATPCRYRYRPPGDEGPMFGSRATIRRSTASIRGPSCSVSGASRTRGTKRVVVDTDAEGRPVYETVEEIAPFAYLEKIAQEKPDVDGQGKPVSTLIELERIHHRILRECGAEIVRQG